MIELSARARQVLELARHEDDPPLEVQQRVERALSARLALGAPGPGSVAHGTAVAKFAAPAAKVLVPLGVAAAVAGAGWFALGPGSSNESSAPARVTPAPSANETASRTPAEPRPVAVSPRLAALEAPEAPEAVRHTRESAPAQRARATREHEASPPKQDTAAFSRATAPAAVVPAAEPKAPVKPAESKVPAEPAHVQQVEPATPLAARSAAKVATDPLLAETEALRAAQRALRGGDAARALELLQEQERTYTAGSLHEERAAARILALCQAGLTDAARASAARFVERWPRSALRARVISACR